MDTLNASNEISSMVINMLIFHLKSECLCSVTGWHVRPLCKPVVDHKHWTLRDS